MGFSMVAIRMASFTTAIITRPAARFAIISSPGTSCLCWAVAFGEQNKMKTRDDALRTATAINEIPRRREGRREKRKQWLTLRRYHKSSNGRQSRATTAMLYL